MPITQATERMSGFSIVLWSGAVQALAFACLFISPALPLTRRSGDAAGVGGNAVGAAGADDHHERLAPRTGQATYQAAFGVVNDLKDAAGPAIGTGLFALTAGFAGGSGIAGDDCRVAWSCRRRAPA